MNSFIVTMITAHQGHCASRETAIHCFTTTAISSTFPGAIVWPQASGRRCDEMVTYLMPYARDWTNQLSGESEKRLESVVWNI
jgi:hypothetical protein